MIMNGKRYASWLISLLMAGLLAFLVGCGGRADAEPTAEGAKVDPVATSVQQTVDAISVAQTVAALTTPGALPTPVVNATAQPTPVVQPTTAILPSPTLAVAPTVAPPTAAPPTAVPPTAVPPTVAPPTAAPPTATATRAILPPNVENDAPGGSFPEDGTVFFNVIVDPTFLFRMDVRVLSVGDFEGAGIDSVAFSISGNGVDYFREERNAGFCVFGGGEPICNPWPRNELGQLTWGDGGPVVQSGEYFVNMGVTADQPDDVFNGNWNWNFNFRVTVP